MKKQCKRKHWSTAINPIQHAIEGASLTPDSILDKLRARELAAVEAFRTGDATLQEWADITSMLNLCETMANGGIGPEALEACKRAENALIEAGKRFETTKRWLSPGRASRLSETFSHTMTCNASASAVESTRSGSTRPSSA